MTPEPFRLDGLVALVAGASGGMGKDIARVLADAGASVCMVARDTARLDAAVKQINAEGGRAFGVAGAGEDPATREASVRKCVNELGRLDILVNTVGGAGPLVPITEIDEAEVRHLTALNLDTALFYAQLVWRAWMSEHGGSIVNITSLASIRPMRGIGWYGVAKAGLSYLTKVLALELAPKVRVNAIAPGMIVTETTLTKITPEYLEQAGGARPLQRLGSPSDIAGIVLPLVAPSGAYVTGQEIVVDGGALLT